MKIYNFTDIFGYSDGERTFCIRVSESELKKIAHGLYWAYIDWFKKAAHEQDETIKNIDEKIRDEYFNNYVTLIDYIKDNSIEE